MNKSKTTKKRVVGSGAIYAEIAQNLGVQIQPFGHRG